MTWPSVTGRTDDELMLALTPGSDVEKARSGIILVFERESCDPEGRHTKPGDPVGRLSREHERASQPHVAHYLGKNIAFVQDNLQHDSRTARRRENPPTPCNVPRTVLFTS